MEKIGYIYLTTNLINGKQYVGQHLSNGFDSGYKGSGTAVKNAFNKYGWDNFKCEVICWCSTQTQLNEAEDNYIRLLNTMSPNGYNLRGGGANGKPCKETRKKISEAMKGQIPWIKGKHHTEEARKKMSEASKGRVSPNKGKTTSEETCKKISESQKKYYANEETRKKTFGIT